PTLTHGEMPYGAGKVAADKYGAGEIVDPRPFAVGSIKACYDRYKAIGDLVPAMGYYGEQIANLETTINNADCDLVLIATPIDLGKLITINKPSLQVAYELEDMGSPTLSSIVKDFLADSGLY
ncbi:MAG: GTPase, partial [Phycisphaerae bacterium]|nr:GTPase [Phycisphaerae bacterium]